MKEKIAITLEEDILRSIDALVENGVGKNRSHIIETFLREQISERAQIHAFIIAHDIKWDNGEYHFSVPKYLLNIDGKSVVFHQVKIMSQGGVRRITVIIGIGQTEMFRKNLESYFPHIKIDFVEVDPLAKTGTALRSALHLLADAEFLLITNGDTYIPELNILDLLDYHKRNNADWTFVLKYIRTNLQKFGNVTIQGNRVYEYIEKPNSPDLFKYLTNCGWYLVNRGFFDNLAYDGDHIEVDLFPNLMEKGEIFAYVYSQEWFHIQSDAEYELANM